MECGGKRSATPLWIEQPEQPATDPPRGRAWFHGRHGFGGDGGKQGERNYEMRQKREKPLGDFRRGKLRLARIGEGRWRQHAAHHGLTPCGAFFRKSGSKNLNNGQKARRGGIFHGMEKYFPWRGKTAEKVSIPWKIRKNGRDVATVDHAMA